MVDGARVLEEPATLISFSDSDCVVLEPLSPPRVVGVVSDAVPVVVVAVVVSITDSDLEVDCVGVEFWPSPLDENSFGAIEVVASG